MTSSTAYVLYYNLMIDASLSASSTSAGSHAQNAIDYRTTTFWRPDLSGNQWLEIDLSAPALVDSFGLYRHNCATAQAVVKVQRWNGAAWVDVLELDDLADDQCVFKLFAGVTASRWRVLFACASVDPLLAVGVVMLGRALHLPYGMPVGFVPPRHNRNTEILNNRTESGQFAGRSIIQRGSNSDLIQNQIKPEWLRFYGEPFIQHAEKKPFFFSWSYVRYPQDAVYCVASNIAEQPYKDHGWQSLRMTLECMA